MKRTLMLTGTILAAAAVLAGAALAAGNDQKAKFYDFSDQPIDGDVKKPPTIVMEARTRAKFEKLLKLKKSFRQAMIDSSKEPILK